MPHNRRAIFHRRFHIYAYDCRVLRPTRGNGGVSRPPNLPALKRAGPETQMSLKRL
ncbi:protein of unknown function [Azospirillum baldaniorum]|uniref:Uncharacterized protein n=1 Tax=Azospirillum baldaniorum TaxID=1064539 RepID=A0A9P1JQY0_9PROT|nr:protein of unknown function [Azospirillum baldaniorum]